MQSDKRPLLIGITGTFGSGKSSVCAFIEKKHRVIYADKLAHEVLSLTDVSDILTKRWGDSIISNDKPDRNIIADIVFQSKTERDFLNSVIHPRVLALMQNSVDNTAESILFFEIPLLFEAGLENCFDRIVLITADSQIRIQRLISGGDITESEILSRFKAQIPDSVKISLSDTVICNDGTIADLEEKTNELLASLPRLHKRSIQPFIWN